MPSLWSFDDQDDFCVGRYCLSVFLTRKNDLLKMSHKFLIFYITEVLQYGMFDFLFSSVDHSVSCFLSSSYSV